MKKVFISAGHSNVDPGAVGTLNGQTYTEARYVLTLRDGIATMLKRAGVPFATDGPPGDNNPLRHAVRAARDCDGVRVEFHLNAGGPTASGIEVLARSEHKALAQSLAAAVQWATKLPLRGDKGWKPESSGQHHRLAFISQAGGMICEVGFISNPRELQTLVDRFDALVKELAAWFEAQAQVVSKAEYAARIKAARPRPTAKEAAPVVNLPQKKEPMTAIALDPRALTMGGENPEDGSGDGPPISPPDPSDPKTGVPVPKPVPPTPPRRMEAETGTGIRVGIVNQLPELTEEQKKSIFRAVRDDQDREMVRQIRNERVPYIVGNGDRELFVPAQGEVAPKPSLASRILNSIGGRLRAFLFSASLAVGYFWQWTLAHRLEIAVWMTLACVVALLVMNARMKREA